MKLTKLFNNFNLNKKILLPNTGHTDFKKI